MFGGLSPKKMQSMMSKMGISQNEIDASKVIIEKNDGSKLIIEDPSVTKMNVQGNEMFQISGNVLEEEEDNSEEDIQTIIEKTNCTEEQAKETLEKTGDLAESIMELSQ